MAWFFDTQTFRAMQGEAGGSTGVDEALASRWAPGVGAEIMGRNKLGPQRLVASAGVVYGAWLERRHAVSRVLG